MSVPTFKLQWSPTTDIFDAPVWVDISSRLLSFTCQRGRQFELDRAEAGTATFVVEDESRSFDPTNVNGEYYPNVLPLKKVQILANFESTDYPIFTAYITEYKTLWENPDYVTVELTATDGFGVLANADLVSAFASFTTAHGGNKDLTFTSKIPGAGGNSITIAYASGASLTVAIDGVAITAHITGSTTAGAIRTALNADPIIGALLDTELAPGSSGVGIPAVMGATNLTGGTFVTELTGDRIAHVLDNIGWPSGDRALDTGTVFVIAQTYVPHDHQKALSHIHDVENSGFALFFINPAGYATFHEFDRRLLQTLSTVSNCTFGDDAALTELEYIELVPTFDDIHIYNIAAVTPANAAVEQVKQDATSILKYGERVLTVQTQCQSTTQARSVATFVLKHYKDPAFRFSSLTFQPVAEDDLWTQALTREISDRITVKRRPPDHSGGIVTVLQQDCFIESIAWNVQAGGDAQISWMLSPASGAGSGYEPIITVGSATAVVGTGVLTLG